MSKYEKTFFLSYNIVKRIIYLIAASNRRRIKLNLEEFVEVHYLKYLLTVLNSNEEYMMEFKNLREVRFTKEDLEDIIRDQMMLLLIDGNQCFEKVSVQRNGKGICYYNIFCSKEFYMICHNYSANINISCFA